MATLTSLVGFELPDDAAEGSINLLPLWTAKAEVNSRQSLEHNTFAKKYAIRTV